MKKEKFSTFNLGGYSKIVDIYYILENFYMPLEGYGFN